MCGVNDGVDLILVETMNTIREAVAATRAARATGLPVLTSFVCRSDGRLFSGERVSKDHPLISRYEGSTIVKYERKAFQRYTLATGTQTWEGDPHGSVFAGVQQLGLKLDSRKAPVDFLVVDKAEKVATEN